MRSKAYRRHTQEREKKRMQKIILQIWHCKPEHFRFQTFERFLGVTTNTPVRCSGSCCGNRRKWDGPTKIELQKQEDIDAKTE